MKTKTKYFIAYYGPTFCRAWDNDKRRWVPYGMNLYTTFFDSLADALKVVRDVRRNCSGWRDDIMIDSIVSAA